MSFCKINYFLVCSFPGFNDDGIHRQTGKVFIRYFPVFLCSLFHSGEELDSLFLSLERYQYGEDKKALSTLRSAVFDSLKDARKKRELEKRLINILKKKEECKKGDMEMEKIWGYYYCFISLSL